MSEEVNSHKANCENHGKDFSEVLEDKRARAQARREARRARREARRAARRQRIAEWTEWAEKRIAQARRLAAEAVITGYGAAILARDRLQDLTVEAHELGTERRTEAGPAAKFLMELFSSPPPEEEEKREPAQVKVPVLPIENYDDLTVGEVAARLDNLTEEQLNTVRDYEVAHKNRKGVLESINRRLAS